MPKKTEVRVRLHPVWGRTQEIRHGGDQAFRGRKSGHQNECISLLQRGHTRCILVERVDNPTDNNSTTTARSLCDPEVDADFSDRSAIVRTRRIFPRAHSRAGVNGYF